MGPSLQHIAATVVADLPSLLQLTLLTMKPNNPFTRTLHHLCMLAIVSYGSITLAVAQGTPPPTDVSPQPPSQPNSTAPTQPQQGWMWWNDAYGRDMNIAVDRMKELQEVDSRYRSQYDALGPTPWTSTNYQTLTERRNKELEGILTPEQYREYTRRSTPATQPNDRTAPNSPNTPNTPTTPNKPPAPTKPTMPKK